MSRKGVKHSYEVVEIHGAFPKVEVGGFLVQAGHVRKYHEPFRRWDFVDLDTGNVRSIVGKHVGEYEKVKDLMAAKRELRAKAGGDAS